MVDGGILVVTLGLLRTGVYRFTRRVQRNSIVQGIEQSGLVRTVNNSMSLLTSSQTYMFMANTVVIYTVCLNLGGGV
jgi:hypothetical protein